MRLAELRGRLKEIADDMPATKYSGWQILVRTVKQVWVPTAIEIGCDFVAFTVKAMIAAALAWYVLRYNL
jgi:hypothetical protein